MGIFGRLYVRVGVHTLGEVPQTFECGKRIRSMGMAGWHMMVAKMLVCLL